MKWLFFVACENSRPSSLPAEWRFARRHSAGSEEGRLFSQAIFFVANSSKSLRTVRGSVGDQEESIIW